MLKALPINIESWQAGGGQEIHNGSSQFRCILDFGLKRLKPESDTAAATAGSLMQLWTILTVSDCPGPGEVLALKKDTKAPMMKMGLKMWF